MVTPAWPGQVTELLIYHGVGTSFSRTEVCEPNVPRKELVSETYEHPPGDQGLVPWEDITITRKGAQF